MPLAKVADRFMARLNELEESGGATPVLLDVDGALSFVYVQYSNLYLLAVARSNINAAAVLVFLHKLIDIFKHYFHEVRCAEGRGAGCIWTPFCGLLLQAPLLAPNRPAACPKPPLPPTLPQLEEESLRDNFVIAYELLDEVCDFGYPQVSAGYRAPSLCLTWRRILACGCWRLPHLSSVPCHPLIAAGCCIGAAPGAVVLLPLGGRQTSVPGQGHRLLPTCPCARYLPSCSHTPCTLCSCTAAVHRGQDPV